MALPSSVLPHKNNKQNQHSEGKKISNVIARDLSEKFFLGKNTIVKEIWPKN